MPVSVKEYLNSMKSIGSSNTVTKPSVNVKDQVMLSNLIEAIAYANSINFSKKTLNSVAPGQTKDTGKEVLNTLKAQEALIDRLANGQKITEEQNKKLISAIDKFYELAGSSEINYKKLADNLEKIVLSKNNLPEAVKTRLINDSRDAHMIGQEAKDSSPFIKILKRIRDLAEDSFQMSKQFGKKLFVSLDAFKMGLLNAFDNLKSAIEDNSIINSIVDAIKALGMTWMMFQGQFKEGNFKWGQAFKQFDNLKKLFSTISEFGGVGKLFSSNINGLKAVSTGLKDFAGSIKSFMSLPKEMKTFKNAFGFLKAGGSSLAKGIGKGIGKGALKKVPVFGTLISMWMAFERWQKQDYLGAFLELGSGVAAMFPGLGTLISIGIDLVNLGRDTGFFKGIGDKTADTAKSVMNNFGENMLMSIPLIGPIFGIAKSIKLFKSGNKKGGLEMIGKSIASILPGGALIADVILQMMGMDDYLKPSSSTSTTTHKFKWPWQKGGRGDADPIYSGGRGAGDGQLSSTQIGNRLAASSLNVAKSMGGTKSTHYCATGVTKALRNALGETIGGHAYQMIDTLKNSAFGRKYFTYKGKANKMTFSKGELPAGAILGWSRYPGNNYGHIEISDGKGLLSSDFYRSSSGILGNGYKRYGIKPDIFVPKGAKLSTNTMMSNGITSTAEDGNMSSDVEAFQPQTFDDLMNAFNTFNESIIQGVPATATKASSMSSPSIDTMSSGTPQASIANSSAKTANSINNLAYKPQPVQVTQPTISSNSRDTMDTEIRDTDLALINSILFQ